MMCRIIICYYNLYIGTCTDSLVYTSQYVYLQANSNQLCATSNFKWNPHAQVYLVVASEYSIQVCYPLTFKVANTRSTTY